jgi:L-fucose mutarotase
VGSVPVEAAAVMASDGQIVPPIWSQFEQILTDAVPLDRVSRHAFYDQCRSSELAVVIATGESALFANLLLTVGVNVRVP